MALPIGAIIEATIVGECVGQTIMNVWHYQVDTVSTITTVSAEVSQFNADWRALGVGSFHTNFLATLPDNYTTKFITTQAIAPTRFLRFSFTSALLGTRPQTETANLQGSLTFQTVLSGRSKLGGKRLLLSTQDAAAGVVGGAWKAAASAFAANNIAPITATVGGGVYGPVIYHRDPVLGAASPIINAFAQDTVRVLRRRTVGLGI